MVKRFLLILLAFAQISSPAAETATGGERQERALWDKDGNLLPESEVNSPAVAWEILKNAGGENDKWKAVGQLVPDGDHGSCTLTLIEPPGNCAFNPNRKAMALTNGHCVGLVRSPDQVLIDAPYSQAVHFNHFVDTQASAIKANVSRTLYATMQGSDVAVVELDKTYAQLAGVKPKKIARAFDGSNLANIASPTDGVEPGQQFLRRSTCSSRGQAAIAEGGFFWPRQIRVDCSVVGGASGSALFKESTGEIMGLVNTGVALNARGPHCTLNVPCEVNGAQASVHNMNYGFDVTFLHRCASQTCEIDPAKSGCPLPDGSGPRVEAPRAIGASGAEIPLDKRGTDAPFSSYQVKWGIAGGTDCDSDANYTPVRGASFRPPITGGPDGVYVLCVRGRTPQGTWLTSMKSVRLDRQAPSAVLQPRNGGWVVHNDDPADLIQGFTYKVVAKRSDCQRDADYRRPSPMDFRILKVPQTSGYLCVRAMDTAGNYQSAANATVQAL